MAQFRGDASEPNEGASDARSLLAGVGYRRLLTGQAISGLGDWMATTALMALAFDLTGSPTAVGGILVVRLLPGLVAGPLAARVTARWARRRTMLAMDATRAGVVAAIPLIDQLWWIYACAFAVEVASLTFLPARDASIPQLTAARHLPLANGLMLASSYATIPLGAAAFAAVSAFPLGNWFPFVGQYSLVFWIDAATFLVSFMLISRLAELPRESPQHHGDQPLRLRDAFGVDIVRAVMPAAIGASLGLGALFSVGIVFVQDVLEASDAAFGLLIVSFGVGATLGVAMLHQRRGPAQLQWARDGIRIAGLSVITISVLPGITLAYLAAMSLGASVSYGLVAGISFLQAETEGEIRTLSFAVFHIAIRLALGGAAMLTGVATDLVPDVEMGALGTVKSPRVVLAVAGAMVVASTAAMHLGEETISLRGEPRH